MNDEKITDLVIRISSELASLNANMKSTLDKLANHELRLMELEKSKGGGLKDDVVQWLVKGLVISLSIIAALAGAGAALKPILGI